MNNSFLWILILLSGAGGCGSPCGNFCGQPSCQCNNCAIPTPLPYECNPQPTCNNVCNQSCHQNCNVPTTLPSFGGGNDCWIFWLLIMSMCGGSGQQTKPTCGCVPRFGC